jgi:gluconolactonase
MGFVDVGPDLGPGTSPNRTYDIEPHAQGPGFDDSAWRVLAPPETMLRLGPGRVSFNWYRLSVTVPDTYAGMTAVFEIVVDDYAEVWVDGTLPLALGQSGGQVVGGFNAPNRVVLGRDVPAGRTFELAVFGINGPISASPSNYIWIRSASLEFHASEPFEEIAAHDGRRLERVATGFEGTEAPVWAPEGALLFSSPATDAIYRWSPIGRVDLFRPKSGASALAYDPDGRLVLCQPHRGRVLRVNPHGDTTVLADGLAGPRALSFAADGTLHLEEPVPVADHDGAGLLATIPLPEEPTGLAWGGEDRRTLYITAETSIYRLRPDREGAAT